MTQKTTGPPGRPILPPEAEDEILNTLFTNMRISSGEIAAILKKHNVSGDTELLQDRYRKQLGQRLMASIRDEQGRREVLARGSEYIVLECCNDRQALQAIRRRIQSQMNGLEVSSMKVGGRIHVLERFLARFSGSSPGSERRADHGPERNAPGDPGVSRRLCPPGNHTEGAGSSAKGSGKERTGVPAPQRRLQRGPAPGKFFREKVGCPASRVGRLLPKAVLPGGDDPVL